MMYPTITVIRKIIIRVWSWKKFNCSIKGELLSCKDIFPHVAILILIKVILYIWSLNSLHYSAILEVI